MSPGNHSFQGYLLVAITTIVGMILAVMPISSAVPPELGYLRPDWVALILFYWLIAVPQRVGLVTVWLVGLMMDVLMGSLLGLHALAYVLLGYFALKIYRRFRMFRIMQQMVLVFVLLIIIQLLITLVGSLAGQASFQFWIALPPLSGALLWPMLLLILRSLRRRFQVV